MHTLSFIPHARLKKFPGVAMRGQFDIFAGSLDNQPLWLEATDGLKTALHRMEQRATAKPGRYFVYSTDSRAVVASIDTDTGEENHPSKPRV